MFQYVNTVIFVSLLLFPSCVENDVDLCIEMGRTEGPIPFRTFAEVSKDSIECFLGITDTVLHIHPKLFIVNNQEAFDTLVECNSYDFDFNFNKYSLLIGYFFINDGPATLSKQETSLYCDLTEQHLMHRVFVDITEYDPYQFTLIQHNAIVPKLPDGLRVAHAVIRNKLYQ